MQKNPKAIHYKKMEQHQATHLRVVSDAAFKKETDDGYSLRGALFLRSAGSDDTAAQKANATIHLVDWVCKSQKNVTRSTFAAELLAGGMAADAGILMSNLLCEIEKGPLSVTRARELREFGGYIPVYLYIDAKSVYAAVGATFIKTPADSSLLIHVQYLRELLGHGIIRGLVWLDTRDMGSDGLTKGAVP